jgi:type I restriction enzyme S subunit
MEGQELPVGWETTRLEQLITMDGLFSDGDWVESKDQDPNGKIRLLQLADIGDSYFLDKSQRFVNEEQYERLRCTEVLEGDILIARMPEPLGRACLVPALGQRLITVVDVAIVRPGHDSVLSQWLMHSINAPQIRGSIELQSTGTTRRRITRKKLAALELPLPPLREQRRIAAKLDTTLASVEACRQRLDGVAAILKRFRQAVLAAATSGELTREWREERGATMDDWSQKCLSDVVIDIEAGLNVLCEERPPSDGERGLVKISSVTWGVFDEDESKTLSAGHDVSEKNRIKAGDFLISRANTNELVGACVIVHKVNRTLYLSDKVLRLLMPEECKPWILMCLRSKSGREQIETFSSGNQLSMRNLSQKSLLSIRVPLPPPEEVEAAVTATNQLHALADQLEARLTAARRIVERLTPALLAKAFRGELVPQDPGDEPASALLERIRAARQAEAGAGKPSRRGRPKAAANPDQLPFDAAPFPPDFLAGLLRECGPLSERALLAVSELEPQRFQQQLYRELESGTAREVQDNGQVLLEAVG